MGKADTHIHSSFKDGLVSPERIVELVAEKQLLNVLAISDHDVVKGAYRARQHAKKKGLPIEVIIASEISTRRGHVLALFIEKPIPKFRSVEETIKAIHAQGGLAVACHPLNPLTTSLSLKTINSIIENKEKDIYFDAIEMANSYPFFSICEKKVFDLNKKLQLPELGASDAHFPFELNTSHTEFEGTTAEDFKFSLQNKKTRAVKVKVPWLKYFSPQFPWQVLRAWTWKSPFFPFQEKDITD